MEDRYDGTVSEDHRLAGRIHPALGDRDGRLGGSTVVIYPLSTREDRTIRWAARIVPTLAVVIILFLTAISVASAGE